MPLERRSRAGAALWLICTLQRSQGQIEERAPTSRSVERGEVEVLKNTGGMTAVWERATGRLSEGDVG